MKNIKSKRKRMRLVPRQSTGLRYRLIIASSVVVAIIFGTCIAIFNFAPATKSYGAINGDYRSKVSGNWSSTATWEKYNGSAWIAAVATPTSTDGVITIQNGHTVTITANVTVDQVTIDAGGAVILNSAKTLTINNGTGTDITVNGTFTNNGLITQNASASILDAGLFLTNSGSTHNLAAGCTFTIDAGGRCKQNGGGGSAASNYLFVNSGGVYQHNMDGSGIPPGTWAVGSTCEVTGVTITVPANISQSYYNFTWNCPSQTGNIDLAGGLNTVNGDFTLNSTGSGELRLSTASSNLTIAGNYIQTGGIFKTVNGNNNKDTLCVAGNWTHTGGTLTLGGNPQSRAQIVFNKSGTQTFTAANNTVSGKVNYLVKTNSILDLGNSIVLGYDFTTQTGSGLIIKSVNGIKSNGSQGNIQVSGTISLSSTTDYTYNGTSAQITGNGLPSTVRNLTINNSSGVTLTSTVAISNNLTLTDGQIITGNNEISVTNTSTSAISGQSDSSYIYGSLRRSISITGIYDFPIGASATYELMRVTITASAGISNMIATFVPGNPTPAGVNNCHSGGNVNNNTGSNNGTNGHGPQFNSKNYDDMLDIGYWTLTPDNAIGTAVYGVELFASGQTNQTATNASDYVVLKRHDATYNWDIVGVPDLVGQLVTSNKVKVKTTGLTDFSHFGAGQGGGSALPIELINFNVKPKDNIVDIKWSTAAEKNNDYFSLERSGDGKTFEVIEKVDGAGNSNTVLNYHTTDTRPLPDKSYYRLKQTDFNGDFTYSPVRVIDRNGKSNLQTETIEIKSVAPNPFNRQFSVTYNLEAAGEVQLMLISMNGQIMFTEKIQADAGVNYYDYNEEKNIPIGNYIITLASGDKKTSKKIIKLSN